MQNAISGAMLLLKLASLYFLVVALFALKNRSQFRGQTLTCVLPA